MPQLTVRYWAAAKAAAGTVEDVVDAASVAEALHAARTRHDAHFAAVLGAASVLVDGARRDQDDTAALPEGSVLEVLPPFAGG